MKPLSNPSRIRHTTVALVTDCMGAKAQKTQSITNPSRVSVTDSDEAKKPENSENIREKYTLSPFLYESVTYPLPRVISVCARVYARGRTDSSDGFAHRVVGRIKRAALSASIGAVGDVLAHVASEGAIPTTDPLAPSGTPRCDRRPRAKVAESEGRPEVR